MLNHISRWLLALGLIPVIVDDKYAEIDCIRRDMRAVGLREVDVARAMGVSEDLVNKTIRGERKKRLPDIIQFIEEKEKRYFDSAQYDEGKVQ